MGKPLGGYPNISAGRIGKTTKVKVGPAPPKKSDLKPYASRPKTQVLTGAVHPKKKRR